jgi:thiamine-monophosphate kinase
LKFLGYKAAIAGFSNIYAMNGYPKQLIVSVGLSKRFSVEDLEEFHTGIEYACVKYGVDIAGVNITSSLTGFSLAVTCIGEADKDKIVYRRNAKPTDLICVSGDLGAAYMGLQLLEREKAVYRGEADFTPDFAGKEYLLERQLRPEARKDIIEELEKKQIIPTSMMDISDGLASELLHICRQSRVGCTVYEERIPIDYQTAMMAGQFNMNLTTAAMNGGDDYELLFTVPLALHEEIQEMEGVRIIGHVGDAENGANLVARDGTLIPLTAQGWASSEKTT